MDIARLTHLKECEGDLYDARPEGEREGAGGAGPGVVVGDERVDGGGADGHLLDGAEHRVEEAGHDGRVQAVLKKTNPNSKSDGNSVILGYCDTARRVQRASKYSD